MLTPPIGQASWTAPENMKISDSVLNAITTRAKIEAIDALINRGDLFLNMSKTTDATGQTTHTVTLQEVLHA